MTKMYDMHGRDKYVELKFFLDEEMTREFTGIFRKAGITPIYKRIKLYFVSSDDIIFKHRYGQIYTTDGQSWDMPVIVYKETPHAINLNTPVNEWVGIGIKRFKLY